MRRKRALPELLAPAGDFECLIAAVAGGADAVYVGGERFGARAYAKNFNIDEMSRAVNYCHLFGVKLYVTVNTLVYDKEMRELIEYARELYRIGVDALIVADLGVIRALSLNIPELELHASTQMSVHNVYGADMAASLGCVRAVPARELSLENIKEIVEKSSLEIEVFLHGALCVSYSGQCLFSSLVGGRSGNRGECAQPCRLPYNNGKYPLSLRDLSLSNHIPELIESGVASLKIEGRMKSPSYVYTVTRIYRRLLDERRSATVAERELLSRAFSRGGFTDGYFTGKPQSAMTGIRSKDDKERSRELSEEKIEIRKRRVYAEVTMRLGEPSSMRIYDGEKEVLALGDEPRPAENAPLNADAVRERLAKMGNTFLSLDAEDIALHLDESVNLSPASINALRREAARLFESSERDVSFGKIILPVTEKPGEGDDFYTAQFLSEDAFLAAKSSDGAIFDRLDRAFIPLFSNDGSFSDKVGAYIPPVVTDSEIREVEERLSHLKDIGVKTVLVGNIGHIPLAKKYGFETCGDYRLNIMNSLSAEVYKSLGVRHALVSPELTLPQARDIGGGVTVYGRIPLMLTERCFISESFGCDKCGSAFLLDRKGERFPMMREHKHRNIILNSAVTYVGDRPDELEKNRISERHFIFTVERGAEIISALRAFFGGKALPVKNLRRIGKRTNK